MKYRHSYWEYYTMTIDSLKDNFKKSFSATIRKARKEEIDKQVETIKDIAVKIDKNKISPKDVSNLVYIFNGGSVSKS